MLKGLIIQNTKSHVKFEIYKLVRSFSNISLATNKNSSLYYINNSSLTNIIFWNWKISILIIIYFFLGS